MGLLPAVLLMVGPLAALVQADSFTEEEVRFESGEVTLSGTILVPKEGGLRPAIVLVHGAGPHTREDQRDEAEEFARGGIVTLIYDKRTEGYTQFERSYDLLANDALAAVSSLRERPDVDRDAVGLWGLSEGAWVTPIAASRSKEVAFVVLVAASGVPPARQHAWNLENNLRHQGVSGSMVEAVSRTGTRLLVDAGLFAEAYHDPQRPLRQVRQPVLALWGEKDRIQPAKESAGIVQDALRRGENTSVTIRIFPDAEHGLRSSPDGFVVRERLAPQYPQTVASWVEDVARGETPGPSITGPIPVQSRPSRPLAPVEWWESDWAQLCAVALLVSSFASYPAAALTAATIRFVRRSRGTQPARSARRTRRLALLLAGAGLAAVLGFVGYFGFLMFTAAGSVGPVVLGRPLTWLALQALAVATCAFAALLATSWWSTHTEIGGMERARLGILLLGGVLFLPWAAYWGLLSP